MVSEGVSEVKNILMAIENCETTSIASPIVEKTLELAGAFSSKVWVLHVAPPAHQHPYNVDSNISRHAVSDELRHEHDFLQHLAKCMQNKNVDASALLVQGPIIRTILHEADRLDTDLIVLGCHRHGIFYGALLDITEEGLLSKCTHPIMFIPE
jgi:nucleotide-binding universal stress UspA family protein